MKRSVAIIFSSILALFSGALVVHAGLITNHTGNGLPPYTKMALYNRVVTVTNGGQSLELGASGQSIVGTNDILFRPGNGASVSSGVTFRSSALNPGTTDVYVSGDVCLQKHSPAGPEDCRHAIASGGSTWYSAFDANLYPFTPGTYLEPIKYNAPLPPTGVYPGLNIGSSGTPVTSTAGPAISLSTTPTVNGQAGANFANLDTGEFAVATRFTGTVEANGGIYISGQPQGFKVYTPMVNGRTIWQNPSQGSYYKTDGVDGRLVGENFGLDADLLNGNMVTVESRDSCSNIANPNSVACLCFRMNYLGEFVSSNWNNSLGNGKKYCLDLANRSS